MKKYKLFILFLLLFNIFSNVVIGQDLILLKNDKKIINITDKTYVLTDKDNKLKIQDIIKNELQNKFVKNNTYILELDNKNKSKLQNIWIKFNLKNLSNHKIYLEIDNIDLPYCEIYILDNTVSQLETYQVKKVGVLVPNQIKEVELNYYLVSLVDAQDTSVNTIYIRFQSNGIRSTRLNLGTLPSFFQRSHNTDVFYGIFFGIILITFFYNLFIYISFKDLVYLWYSIYVISRGCLTLANQGYGSNFLWSNFSNYNENIIVGIFYVWMFSYIFFSILFLETSKRSPILHKGLIGLIIFLVLSLFASFFYFYTVVLLWQAIAIIVFMYIFVLSIYIYIQGNKIVRFYVLAHLFFILSLFLIILKVNQIIPQNFITINIYPFGVTLEIIFFFLALTEKIKVLRKERKVIQEENIKLIRQQKESLEEKIKERTVALEKANTEVINQNEELHQNQEQLHILNEELTIQKDSLYQLNTHLEDLITIKTQKLEQQNQQLANYAYFNSHKVRGALARIMGLCMVLAHTKDNMSNVELFDLINKILISANELDVVVKEINLILSKDLEKELDKF